MDAWLARLSPRLPDRERTRVLLLGVLVGVLGGVSAGLFDLLLVEVGRYALGTPEPSTGGLDPWRALAAPALTALLAGVVGTLLTRKRQPQGIADVIQHLRSGDAGLTARDGILSGVAAALAVGGGQSAGREGPIVQLAASISTFACERLKLSPSMTRALVAAGAAAGIAASFNSPLGGAFFAMEALLGSFALEAFAPIVVASVVGTVVGQAMLGERLAVALPPFEIDHPVELLAYPVLGIACGLVAIAFRRLMRLSAEQLARLPGPPALRPVVSGVAVGVVAALGLPQIMGNGYAFLEVMIREESAGIGLLLLILVAKLLASALAVSSKAGGGMFAPSLFLGAVTGQLVGVIGQELFPGIVPHPGALGTVGMGAVAAAVAHTPITMALMLFEMTGNYAIVLPLLVAIAIANVLAHATDRHSVYVQFLLDRGVRLDRGREELVLYELRVADVMRTHGFPKIGAEAGFQELGQLFLSVREDTVFVVDGPLLVGAIDIQDVKGLLADRDGRGEVTARSLCRTVPTIRPEDPLAGAMELFFRSGSETLPVLEADGRLCGVLAERDVVGALNREILRQDALMARIEHGPPQDRQTDFFELPEGYGIAAVHATRAAGRSIRELELPRRIGATVLAVDVWDEALGQHQRRPATAERVLQAKDRLVMLAPTVELERLAEPDTGVEVELELAPKGFSLPPTPAVAKPDPSGPEGGPAA